MSLDEWLGIGIPAESIDAAIDWVAKIDQQPLTSEQERVFFGMARRTTRESVGV